MVTDATLARDLVAADAATVVRVRKRLASRNPYTATVTIAEIRDVAELYVRLAIDDPAETAAVGWAVYLRRAAFSLYGASDARTEDMGSLIVDLARRRGTPAASTDLLMLSTGRLGGVLPAGEVIADRFSVVDLLHTHGLCEAAEREALAALFQWAPHHDDAPEVTDTYLVDALAALDHCGRVKQGKAVINAYGAMLPEPGTGRNAFLRSSIGLRLGNRQDVQLHQAVCDIRRSAASCPNFHEDLRATVLRALACGDESTSQPIVTAEGA